MKDISTLILFTSDYPYGCGETFIDQEFEYLAESFSNIIVVSNNLKDNEIRKVYDNVKYLRFPYELRWYEKLMSVFFLFDSVFYKEAKIIRKNYQQRVSFLRVKVIISTLFKGKKISKLINSIIRNENLESSEVLLYSYWMNDMAFGIAAYSQKKPGVKSVCRAHGWDVYFERNTDGYLPMRKFIIDHLDKVFCISKNGMDYLTKIPGIDKDKLCLFRLGVKIPEKKKYGPRTGSFHIVSCSNVIPLKRIGLMIDSLKELDDKDVRWTHIGDGTLVADLKKIVAEKKLNFYFLGQLSNAQVLDFYKNERIDLFVNLSSTEGLPVSIMEAMSFGIPVLATDVGGVSEIVCEGSNGYLINSNPTRNDVAGAIQRYIALEESELVDLRQNAYQTCINGYNEEKNYSEYVISLQHIIGHIHTE